MPGVRFVPRRYTPTYSTHKDKDCGGVQIIVDDWQAFRPVHTGLAIAATVRRLYPKDWKLDRYDVLLVHRATWDGLKTGADWRDLEKAWQPDLKRFRESRRSFLLYE